MGTKAYASLPASFGHYHPSVTVSPTIPGDLRSIPVDQWKLKGDRTTLKGLIKVWIPFLTGAYCKFWLTRAKDYFWDMPCNNGLFDQMLLWTFGVHLGSVEEWYSWYAECKSEIEIKVKNLFTQKAFKSGNLSLSPWSYEGIRFQITCLDDCWITTDLNPPPVAKRLIGDRYIFRSR